MVGTGLSVHHSPGCLLGGIHSKLGMLPVLSFGSPTLLPLPPGGDTRHRRGAGDWCQGGGPPGHHGEGDCCTRVLGEVLGSCALA